MAKGDSNIPLYNDEQINKEIEKRRREKENELKKQELEKIKQEKINKKLRMFRISEIKEPMLFAIYFMISTIGLSIYTNHYQYVLYSAIGIVSTVFIGKRLKFVFDDTLNILMWNISQTFRDFIDYRLKLDFFSESEDRIEKTSIILAIIFALFNSSNILYGLFFSVTIISYLIGFANRELEVISSNSLKVAVGSLIGLVLKTLVYSLFTKSLSIDYMNIVMINIFTVISVYTESLPIHEPK